MYDRWAKKIDARFCIPRPANYQHYSEFRCLIEFLMAITTMVGIFLLGLAGSICVIIAGIVFFPHAPESMKDFYFLFVVGFSILVIAFSLSDASLVYYYKYNPIFKRETHGNSAWARRPDLLEAGYLIDNDKPETGISKIRLGGLGGGLFRPDPRYELGIKFETLSAHGIIIGPPGSGKTKTFFMYILRQVAPYASAVILDIKRELYKYTSAYYSNVFTLDLIRPESSARLDLLGPCRRNPEFAEELAALIIGVKNERGNATENEEFWNQSSTLLLQALLLHVSDEDPHAHIGTVLDFVSIQQLKAGNDETQPNGQSNSLDQMLSNSRVPEAREAWGLLRSNDPKTLSNIFSTLIAKLNAFRSPKAIMLFTPPTEEEKAKGVQLIDMKVLRQPGNAIYVSVTEGQAAFFKNVLATIFGTFASYLRKTTETDGCICISVLDEAGTVPIRGLAEDINAGRGRKMAYCLGFQSIPQIEAIYGSYDAKAITEGTYLKIVLPGVSGETAEWASRLAGRITTFQHSTNDSKADAFDSSHMAEIGRELIDPFSINHLLSFHQALAFLRDAPPIRLAFPPNQTEVDSFPVHHKDFIDAGERPRRRVPHEWAQPLSNPDIPDFFEIPGAVPTTNPYRITNTPDIWGFQTATPQQEHFRNFESSLPNGYYRDLEGFDPAEE